MIEKDEKDKSITKYMDDMDEKEKTQVIMGENNRIEETKSL